MTTAHVVWVSYHPPAIISRGYWDQGVVESLLAASGGWRGAGLPTFQHHDGFATLPDGEGAVVVVPARWHAEPADITRLNRDLAPLPWLLLVLTGDEETIFPRREVVHPNMRVWVQTPRAGDHEGASRLLGDWWPPTTQRLLAGMEGEATHRPNPWWFSGQVNNRRREEAHAAMSRRVRERRDGSVSVTRGFGGGMGYGEYLRTLAGTRAVPCPAGTFSPDSFRVFEALEAGCVPLVDATSDRGDRGYWEFLLGPDLPFPMIEDWGDDFGRELDAVLRDWPARANRCFAWWQRHKRNVATWLVDDLRALGAPMADPHPSEAITVLMPTSPIPAHPDPTVIFDTMRSVRERLPFAEIIVMIDGVREEQAGRRDDYREFTRRLLWECNYRQVNTMPLLFDTHHHQAAMTREALRWVRTPTVLFVEHDTPLVGDVDWGGCVAAIAGGEAQLIRFHHETHVLEPHQHLMLDRHPQMIQGVPLLRTVQYSQRPHLAATDLYRRMIEENFAEHARTMIEDVMHGVVHQAWKQDSHNGWGRFRMWMYAPEGNIQRSTHTDGRGEDPKYEMTFRYPGVEVPAGAPAPARDEHQHRRTTTARGDRVGIWGARADHRGLATQTVEFARHLAPAAVMGIDMADLSPYRPDWGQYDPTTLTVTRHDQMTYDIAQEWLGRVDVVLGAETFYYDWFTDLADRMGVRTVLQPNYEFFHHVTSWTPPPDLLLAPSTWHLEDMPGAVHLPLGVDRGRLPFRLRTEARTFLHVIGHAAAHDRQGTRAVWDALDYVTEPVRILVRSQRGLSIPRRWGRGITVEVRTDDVDDYWRLYDEGDVLLHPRRYGGQSLVMNEALSTGMPVLMPDAPPQNDILPPGMRVYCEQRRTWRSLVGELPLYDTNPRSLAARIDELARDPAQVEDLSRWADGYADTIAWPTLLPRYREALRGTS